MLILLILSSSRPELSITYSALSGMSILNKYLQNDGAWINNNYLAPKGTFSSSITGSEDIYFGEFDYLVLSSDSVICKHTQFYYSCAVGIISISSG